MRNGYLIAASVVFVLAGTSRWAEALGDSPAANITELEEIVITAQKRTE